MYKGIIKTPIAVTANTDIPFNTILNTNWKTSPSNGVVGIREPGYWNVKTQINFTGSTGDIELRFYNDGEAITDVVWTFAAAPSDVITATLTDAIKVIRSLGIDFAKLSVRSNLTMTINSGVFIIKEIK